MVVCLLIDQNQVPEWSWKYSLVMDEAALEQFFDNLIANDSSKVEDEEELTEEEELCLSLLPDELLTPYETRQKNTDDTRQTAENDTRTGLNCTCLDYSSQNSTQVSEVPGVLSLLEQRGSCICPTTSMMPVKIQNVIATVKLGCRLDLNIIAHKARNVEYKPKTFRGLIMRIREPRTTATIYESGNIVCSGANSEDQSRVATRRYARIVQRLGFPVSFLNFKIQNLVATCSTFPVSLERLMLAHHQHCSYEPELFPGLFCSVIPGITATIFASGRLTLSGAKKADEMYKALDTIYQILSCFRRQ
ncbi:uncharacterized protein LOC108890933 [Lates calcarifer]|uniref:Uncharacterized protein LOC108890933 n=1 Tax=Lates calcarifer TaxID=8187 RepID=A0AAJ7Q0M6_LATCA|nr:uncharacterized protein LOC108890933 [Lates calcarifer]